MTDRPRWSCLLAKELSIAKGPPLSEEPGLGIPFDWERLREFKVNDANR